jgi:hypothetical protein
VAVGVRVTVTVTVLAGLSLLAAIGENWLLWGYLVSRPTLTPRLADAVGIRGFSVFTLDESLVVSGGDDRTRGIEDRRGECLPVERNECREGAIIVRLEQRFGDLREIPDVANGLLQEAWQELRRKGWFPSVRDPRYSRSGQPVGGAAVHFRRIQADRILLAYRTSELANDTYAYSEALFDLSGGKARLVEQTHFYLDIAGLEGVEWPLLWPLNFLALGTLSAVLPVTRWFRSLRPGRMTLLP